MFQTQPMMARESSRIAAAHSRIAYRQLDFIPEWHAAESRNLDAVWVAIMRRMVKDNLLKFDSTPLFPERIAWTVPLQAVGPGSAPLPRSYGLCARGIQSRRGA
jgi:hypothetical protein